MKLKYYAPILGMQDAGKQTTKADAGLGTSLVWRALPKFRLGSPRGRDRASRKSKPTNANPISPHASQPMAIAFPPLISSSCRGLPNAVIFNQAREYKKLNNSTGT
jgi:hypothetical protein